MYFTSTYDGKAYRLDMMTKNVTCVWYDPDLKPVSVKLHRDGRLFISCSTGKKSGRIVVNPDGSEECVLAEGYDIDDIVFDRKEASILHFVGTVYGSGRRHILCSPDLKKTECFLPNLCA